MTFWTLLLSAKCGQGILAGAADSQVLYTDMAIGTTVTFVSLYNGSVQEELFWLS